MDYDLIKTGALAIYMAANFIIGFFVMLDRRERVSKNAIDKLEKTTNERISQLHQNINDGHKKHDGEIVGLHKRMDSILSSSNEISHKLGTVSGNIDGLKNQVTLIIDSLINRNRKDD